MDEPKTSTWRVQWNGKNDFQRFAKEGLERIKRCGELKFIKAYCPKDMSHADWIRSIR